VGFSTYDHFDSRLSPEGQDYETFPNGGRKVLDYYVYVTGGTGGIKSGKLSIFQG
jgi:hypothetical protein